MKPIKKINSKLFDTENLISRVEQNKTSGGNKSDINYIDSQLPDGGYDITVDSVNDNLESTTSLDKPTPSTGSFQYGDY